MLIVSTKIKRFFIGTSGWSYKHWDIKFYPKDLAKKDWFEFYTRNFKTVEINYSFYRWPRESIIRKWYKLAPKEFYFTMKAPRTITHIKKLKDINDKVGDFYKLTDLLQDKKGCHLFQLPPFIKYNKRSFETIKNFCESLNPKEKNVIEFRHRGWWKDKVYNMLKKYNITFCIVSGLQMPDDIIITTETAYFRFHGRKYVTNYSDEELKNYSNKIKELDCKKIYCYFNNDNNAYAPYNAKKLINLLRIDT